MCGRDASSRRPEDLIEEFEVEESRIPAALEPDYNVAPTKEVYAVVARSPDKEKATPPQRQLRVLSWGLIPSWAKDASIGNRMINARMETVAREARLPPGVRRAPLPAARRRLLRVVPHRGAHESRQAEEAAVLHQAHATAGCSRWRGSTRSGVIPTRRGRPGPLPVDLHGAHHPGGGLPRPHPRPDAADGGARTAGRPGWTRAPGRRDRLALLEPAAPGLLEASRCRRWSATSATTARAGRAAPARLSRGSHRIGDNGPMSDVRTIPTPHGDARLVTPARVSTPSRPCWSATAPGSASTPTTSRRWRRAARPGHHRAPSRAAVARGRPQGRHRPADARRRGCAAPPTDPAAHPARGRRTLRRRPLGGPLGEFPRRLGRAWRCRSRCTRRADRRSRGWPSSPPPASRCW